MSTQPRSVKHSKQAFTLVELLVVIGIIALLISILLPVLSSAQKSAQSVKCESNLKQIGLAMLMYAQQYKEKLPASYIAHQSYSIKVDNQAGGQVGGSDLNVFWWQRLQIDGLLPGAGDPSKSPFICPSAIRVYQPYAGTPLQDVLFNCTYGINNFLTIHAGAWSWDGTGMPKDDVYPVSWGGFRKQDWPKVLHTKHSTETILVADNVVGCMLTPWDPNSPPAAAYDPNTWDSQYDWQRHGARGAKIGMCNALFLDGHVAPIRQGQTSTTIFGIDDQNFVADVCSLNWQMSPGVAATALRQWMPY